jgi:hypothetical protein
MQTLQELQNGALKGAVSLKLSEGLKHFPTEIYELAETLEILDLSGNLLKELPADLGKLTKLRILFCSDNLFTTLPEVLADCPLLDIVGFKANQITTVPAHALNPNLRWLILTNNQIEVLPDSIGNCHRMQKLMLAGNKLSDLPSALSQCCNLSLLRISANRLRTLPSWLLTMPRLSWLATSGNPFSYQPKAVSVPLISWQLLQTEHILGQGASGIIYKGTLLQDNERKDVAIKLFKGDVTSDGLPEDELNAFIAAGNHEGLSQLIGQITDHPEGKKGVVMELMDKRFYNLGLPPSFESCTRDVFTNCNPISAAQAVKIATTIASAACHLHSLGIMHGDLYAHNTLIDEDGNTSLSDFGAASFYDVTNTETAKATECIEVSAFGCLLDDLLQLSEDTSAPAIIARLETLRDAAMAPDVHSRPDFNYLHKELLQLQQLK